MANTYSVFQVGCCSGSISILRNASTPGMLNQQSFEPSYDFTSGGYVTFDVGIGDLDGDQRPELVLLGVYGNPWQIYIFANQSTPGNLSFQLASTITTFEPLGDGGSSDFHVQDVTGDGRQDIVISSINANIVFANRTGEGPVCSRFSFERGIPFAKTSSNYTKLEITDFN